MAFKAEISTLRPVAESGPTSYMDIEQKAVDDAHLRNTTIQNFVWRGVTVTVKDNKTKKPKAILDGIDGIVRAGEFANSVVSSLVVES